MKCSALIFARGALCGLLFALPALITVWSR
ncbi:hypothetical protein ABIC16_002228 [Sphingomonas sp. PvP055]